MESSIVTLTFGQTFLFDGHEYTITQVDRKQLRDGHSISILAWDTLIVQKSIDDEAQRRSTLAGTAKLVQKTLDENEL
jgi:hypothetical protein